MKMACDPEDANQNVVLFPEIDVDSPLIVGLGTSL